MIQKLPYLVAEINAALEVYLTGRTGQQYNRTAYILCDDAAELAGKLFLLVDNPQWSDSKVNGRFKNFKNVTAEVRGVFLSQRAGDHAAVDALLDRIEGRRDRRNGFFHSTHLLDLNLHGIGSMQLELNNALQHPAIYAAMPSDILDPTHTLFVSRKLVFRLSKWCDHEGAGENDARKFTRKLFRHSNEEGTIPRRFLDQENRAKPSQAVVLNDFVTWADAIIAAWGTTPLKPPAIAAALGTWS